MADQVVLVTGSEPYGGRGINPAAEIAGRVDGQTIASVPVVGRTMPVSFRTLRPRIEQLLRDVRPAVVVSLGLWPGEPAIRLERVAVNLADFEVPDNEGTIPQNVPLEATGPAAVPARLPLPEIERALLDVGIPARLSSSAGTHLCNATMYHFLRATEAREANLPCGLVHLPYLPEQVAELLRLTRAARRLELHQRADLASMDLATMAEAVRIILGVTLESRRRDAVG